jgi:hypothetical protein
MLHHILGFLPDLVVAAALILVTCVVHAIGLDLIMSAAGKKFHAAMGDSFKQHIYKISITVFCVMGIFTLITAHVWLWAVIYYNLEVPELKTVEDSVYFSTVMFTTLGLGDIYLQEHWRILSATEAANGIIILGWSTALLFEVMTILYPRRLQDYR